MSFYEQRKRKHNHLIVSANAIRSKHSMEMTYTCCKQKVQKVSNHDRTLSIEKEMDCNDLINYMEITCPFQISDESEIGTVIVSNELIWNDVGHVKVHLNKSKSIQIIYAQMLTICSLSLHVMVTQVYQYLVLLSVPLI